MAVVDSSVLVAAFERSDEDHTRARRTLAKESVLGVCAATLEETTRILRRFAKDGDQDGNRVAREALTALRSMPGYRHLPDDVEEAAVARYVEDPKLSFVDAWTIELAKATGQDLLTFDLDHQRAWKAARS